MKNKFSFLLIMLLLTCMIRSYSQDSCKVLKPEISGKYQGSCKKGLANGKGVAKGIDTYAGRFKNGLPDGAGIYTWANGNTFDGKWKNGMKHGEGILTLKMNGKDSVVNGLWEKDTFIKKIVPPPYEIYIARDLDKYSITRTGDGNKVSLKLMQMGMQNTDISNFSFFADNGTYQPAGNTYIYYQVIFPVKIKITYITKNKLKTSDINPSMELIINEPGEWKIVLTN